MKKGGKFLALFFGALLLAGLLAGFVSAVDTTNALKPIVDMISGAINAAYHALEPALALLVGETAGTTIFLSKVLIAILIFSVFYAIMSASGFFGDQTRWAIWVSSLVLSLLGVRFLNEEWVTTAMLPSGVFAVAMSALIPLAAFGFVVFRFTSKTARRVSWVLLGSVFLMMWATRTGMGEAGTVYPLAAIACLVLIFADGTIKKLQDRIAREKAMTLTEHRRYLNLSKSYEEAEQRYETAIRSGNTRLIGSAKREVDRLDRELAKLKV